MDSKSDGAGRPHQRHAPASKGCTRCTAFCTSVSKSCTPKLRRLKPSDARCCQALGRGGARVHLDRDLGTRCQPEGVAQHGHQPCEFSVGQEGGCATAQVQLRHRLATAQHGGVQRHLLRQRVQVFARLVVVLGDDLVAGAVVAHRFAERDVDVQRQRWLATHHRATGALRQRLGVFHRPEGFDEAVGRGVGGVAGPWPIEAAQHRVGQHGHGVNSGVRHAGHCAKGRTPALDLAQSAWRAAPKQCVNGCRCGAARCAPPKRT